MPLRIIVSKPSLKTGQHKGYISGIRNDFARYERNIFSGRIPCPFTVEFKDTRYKSVETKRVGGVTVTFYEETRAGRVLANGPIPLTPSGAPKVSLFKED